MPYAPSGSNRNKRSNQPTKQVQERIQFIYSGLMRGGTEYVFIILKSTGAKYTDEKFSITAII
jgi:hypothetical protein